MIRKIALGLLGYATVACWMASSGTVEAQSPAPDFTVGRKALIGAIPSPPADAISFDAAQVNPLVQDDADFGIHPAAAIRDVPHAG